MFVKADTNGKQKVCGNFKFMTCSIQGLIGVETKRFGDSRGSFSETYKAEDFIAGGISVNFVQDNQSSSVQGVLRGLHFQKKHPQSKLVRVVEGEVFDVAVDLRKDSKTFGEWNAAILSAENGRQLFIPKGFAHGFLVLSKTATFCYKCDDVYHPNDEGGLPWNDPDLGIVWPDVVDFKNQDLTAIQPLLSEKDKKHPSFQEFIASLQD